jgi:hypothetical protein
MPNTIEELFVEYFSSSLLLFQKKSVAYQFLCPYCQSTGRDSKGKLYAPSKAKGYLYPYGNTWNYKCHKCGEHQSFVKFLEVQFPLLHFEYVRLRDQLGTSGFQTNCPSLETLLKKRGMLSGQPPQFHADPKKNEPRRPAPHSAVPIPLSPRPAAPDCPAGFKLTIEPPMRSPQQQAGHQSRLNYQVKQHQQKKRREAGDSLLG